MAKGRVVTIEEPFTQVLDEMIQEKIESTHGTDQKLLRNKYRLMVKSLAGTKKNMTFPDFAYLATCMEVPIKSVFDKIGIEIEWPCEGASWLAQVLQVIRPASKAKLATVVRAMTPEFWLPDGDTCKLIMTTPTKRLYYAIRNSYTDPAKQPKMVEQWGNAAVIKVWNDRKLNTIAPIKDILEIGKKMMLSPAWLLTWVDGNTVILADSPVSEFIIAGYLFMSEENQMTFNHLVDSLLTGQEEM